MAEETKAPETKPGYKTTEFYLSMAATVVGFLLASGALPSEGPWLQIVGCISAVLASMGYTYSRGAAKKPPAPPPAA